MENSEKFCNRDMHDNVINRLNRNEERLNNHSEQFDRHEERIVKLERNDDVLMVEMKHLTSAVRFQTKAIWGLMSTILLFVLNKILGGVL